MFLGVGKSLMEAVYLAAGLIPSSVSRNPANSTYFLENLNLSAEKTRPCLLQCEIMLHILRNFSSIVSDQVMISLTIFSQSLLVEDGQCSSMASVYLP